METGAGNVCLPVGGATTQTRTGGSKPLHRFLRAEPKCVGIVMMFMGSCMFMFGVPLKKDKGAKLNTDIYSSFWLGILYFISGLLYVLSEREPTKKIITASFALSIVSIIGSVVAAISCILVMLFIPYYHFHEQEYFNIAIYVNYSQYMDAVKTHFMPIYILEGMFLFQSLLGIVILFTMSIFARMALRSTQTQTMVIMHNLPETE